MWEKHLSKQNGEGMQVGESCDQNPEQDVINPSPMAVDDHSSMEVTESKVSNREMKRIQMKWGTRRSIKKLKAKRLKKKKGHAQW